MRHRGGEASLREGCTYFSNDQVGVLSVSYLFTRSDEGLLTVDQRSGDVIYSGMPQEHAVERGPGPCRNLLSSIPSPRRQAEK